MVSLNLDGNSYKYGRYDYIEYDRFVEMTIQKLKTDYYEQINYLLRYTIMDKNLIGEY